MKVNILGTEYEIDKRPHNDRDFEECEGYCDVQKKLMAYCDLSTVKGWKDESEYTRQRAEKRVLRHEIVHAFLFESGLWAKVYNRVVWVYDTTRSQ